MKGSILREWDVRYQTKQALAKLAKGQYPESEMDYFLGIHVAMRHYNAPDTDQEKIYSLRKELYEISDSILE